MSIRTDFHTHILPGIDDGSGSLDESVTLLRMEAEQGIRCVAATPHFYARHDRLEHFLERRARAEEALRAEMKKHPGLPELVVGAEVSFFNKMSESELLPQLTIGGKRYILIEMPSSVWTEETFRELGKIPERQGLIPIIAHIDRYIGPFSARSISRQLERLPVLVQANGSFFLKPASLPLALRMLKSGQIHLLGSDCHNLESRRPNLGAAIRQIERRLGAGALDEIRSCECEVLGVAETLV